MAQITVRRSEAQSGVKGGISIGTGRSNQESALAVAAEMIERSHGSVDMSALREAISEQHVGAPENNQEALEEFEEALDLGISAEIFNSAINTKALIKAAQDKWVNQGTPVTAADVQEIDAPIKEVQRAAAMTDYNRMTNRDPSQTVAELAPDSPTLFGIGKDTQISDLTDKQLGDLVKPSNIPGTSRIYYTGQWAKDVYDNFTNKQAAVIFSKVRKLEPELTFYQSKLETFKAHEGGEWTGYDYYAKKN